ncbi:MAG: glycosyltransferase family 2 protein [bacterium]
MFDQRAIQNQKDGGANKDEPEVTISVVIPSYNPGKEIHACLASLWQQKVAIGYEVIVVDSSEQEQTEQWQKAYPGLRVIHLEKRTYPGAARNIGARAARGSIVTFTDTDCRTDPRWLEKIWEAHQKGYDVVGGSVVNGTPGNYIGTAEYLLEFNEMNPWMKPREVSALPSCNLSIRRSVFSVCGYLEDAEKGSDTLFCSKVIAHGLKIFFTPAAKVFHVNRCRLKKYLRNQKALGRGACGIRLKARRHGAFLIKYPVLISLIPLMRAVAISRRLLHSRWRLFGEFLWHFPLILVGLVAYTAGFIAGYLVAHRNGMLPRAPHA